MGWGEVQGVRPRTAHTIQQTPMQAVEAERDQYRQAITDAVARLDSYPLTKGLVADCRTCQALAILRDALEGGA